MSQPARATDEPLVPSKAQRRVLGALDGGAETLAELSVQTGSHPNTLRDHLMSLVSAGFVVAEPEQPRSQRGRPAMLYRRLPLADAASIAAALADEVSHLPNGDDVALRAGARWEALTGAESDETLEERLHSLGFEPARIDQGFVLRSCPVAEAAAAAPGVVCRMHLGAIQHRWPDANAVELIPQGHPEGCLLRLDGPPAERGDASAD